MPEQMLIFFKVSIFMFVYGLGQTGDAIVYKWLMVVNWKQSFLI